MTVSNQDVKTKSFIHKIFTSKEKEGSGSLDFSGECKQCKTRSEKWTKASISTCCCNTQQMKIVVKVPMHCDKCRTKALKIAAAAHGVSKVSIDKDLVEVIGDDVDPFCLMKSLRKRFGCCCALVKVEEVKPPPRPPRPPPPPPPASCVQNCCTCTPHCRSMYCVQYCCTPQFRPMYCELVHEYPEPPTCSIM